MDLFKYFNDFSANDEVFILYGDFNDEITSTLSELNTYNNTDDKKINKRLSYLTIETFQNIIRHGYESSTIKKIKRIKTGLFSYTKINNAYILGAVNQIEKEKASILEQQLDGLNQLTDGELKEKYLETLSNKNRTENGGAGVGLISILRKSTGNLFYKFIPVNDKISRFIFQSNLVKDNKIAVPFLTENHFELMSNNDIILLKKGAFNHSSMLLITDMLNSKLKVNSNSTYSKIFFFVIREMIQNIYQHGDQNNQEGIFILREDNERLNICCGNYVQTSKTNQLSNYINQLNELDQAGLKQLYKEKLFSLDGLDNSSFSGGIGLLEIKKLVNSKINYNFDFINDEISFFSIKIRF